MPLSLRLNSCTEDRRFSMADLCCLDRTKNDYRHNGVFHPNFPSDFWQQSSMSTIAKTFIKYHLDVQQLSEIFDDR